MNLSENSYRRQKPRDRVWCAMRRLTRDKWICGEEVERIGHALARCASRQPTKVFEEAISDRCLTFGMTNGRPLTSPYKCDHKEFLEELDRVARDKRKVLSSNELDELIERVKGKFCKNSLSLQRRRDIPGIREVLRLSRANPEYPKFLVEAAYKLLAHLTGRQQGTPYSRPPTERDYAQRMHMLPLGPDDTATAMMVAKANHPRKKHWQAPEPALTVCKPSSVIEYRYSKRGVSRLNYGTSFAPIMRAAARISRDGSILTALIGYNQDDSYTVSAPNGYKWGISHKKEVRLICLSDGTYFYPNTDDIRGYTP